MKLGLGFALALLLAACNAPSPSSSTATAAISAATVDVASLDGAYLIAEGDGFRVTADPTSNMIVNVVERDEFPVPYAAPTAGSDGAQLKSENVTLTFLPGPCTYHTAAYPYRAHIEVAGVGAHDGCATPRWDRDIVALMPQIDACLAASPAKTVTYAARLPDGHVLVRLDSENGSFDCNVTGSAAQVAAMDGNVNFGGAGAVRFYRANPDGSGANPGGECFEAPSVRDANGKVLGWTLENEDC